MKAVLPLAGLVLLCACSTHPITGREQILALPAIQAAHADIGYVLATGAQAVVHSAACARECADTAERAKFVERVRSAGRSLEVLAFAMAPDLRARIGGFDIEVLDALGAGTASSAGGRIALGSGLAALGPTDTVLAFLVAREMAHVIARHAEENAGISLLVSAFGMLLPGVNAVVRLAVTTASASALKHSWAGQQQREADEIAVTLLERAGLAPGNVALGLEVAIEHAQFPDGEWGMHYRDSTLHVLWLASTSRPPSAGD